MEGDEAAKPILEEEEEEEEEEQAEASTASSRVRQRRVLLGAGCAAGVLLAAWRCRGLPAAPGRSSGTAQPLARHDGFLVEAESARSCLGFPGVKLHEDSEAKSLWPKCSKKWDEDCSNSGCCVDPDMKCYEKNMEWSACSESCDTTDANNESWSCRELAPVLPHSSEICQESCKQDHSCRQAIFDASEGGSCSISSRRHSTVAWAADNFNSSFCGSASEEDMMDELQQQVNGQLPMRLPESPVQNCSWAGEDCAETRCCNEVACDESFSQCFAYSCYRKTDYFASCRIDEPPKKWDGKWLGGGRQTQAIGPAGSQVLVQETSLYCITIVNWDAPAPKPFWSTEAELANNMKDHGVGIFQCDGHDFFDGQITAKAKWGSFSNIDVFMGVWQKVREKGAYKDYAWTVKVDADAVFFPNRLKMHLDKLRTPRGAKVYLENNDYRFKFMGSLEIFTREAADVFLEQGHSCIRGKHEGGEDFFTKGCLDGLGVDHQSDFSLLRDKYADQDTPCTNGWTVAFHFHKKVNSWNWCYNEAVCGTRAKSCPEGLEVAFVVPFAPGMR